MGNSVHPLADKLHPSLSQALVAAMSLTSRIAPQLRAISQVAATPVVARTFTTNTPNTREPNDPQTQRFPIGAFYQAMLDYPTPFGFETKPEVPPKSADPAVQPAEEPATGKKKPGRKAKTESTPPPTSSFTPDTSTAEEKALRVFGKRLDGEKDIAAHSANKRTQSRLIAGVLVPPEPQEPDNCCMSGCVNCVWDLFREDMEEYQAKRLEAESAMKAEDGGAGDVITTTKEQQPIAGMKVGDSTMIAKDTWEDDLFAHVPVGIREFMKQEKKLKEKHAKEQQAS